VAGVYRYLYRVSLSYCLVFIQTLFFSLPSRYLCLAMYNIQTHYIYTYNKVGCRYVIYYYNMYKRCWTITAMAVSSNTIDMCTLYLYRISCTIICGLPMCVNVLLLLYIRHLDRRHRAGEYKYQKISYP